MNAARSIKAVMMVSACDKREARCNTAANTFHPTAGPTGQAENPAEFAPQSFRNRYRRDNSLYRSTVAAA
ncbi:MAG: hypothetical protein ACT4N4_09625, partial [Rhodospirillales bacterium]